jgi:hypothetical protein
MTPLKRLLGIGTVLAVASCVTPAPPPPAEIERPEFSAVRAWGDLEQLVAIGPRVPGTPGAAAARAYLHQQLEALGLSVTDRTTAVDRPAAEGGGKIELTHVTAVIPGAGEDIVLLVAPYDTPAFDTFSFVGANDGASGAAVLLEVARSLAAHPLPYTVWVTFVDGDAVPAGGTPGAGLLGSRALVSDLQQSGALASIRLVVYLNQVGDAELRVAPDLASHRIYRQVFYAAARRLGHTAAFPADAPFESAATGHRAFSAAGMRRVVAFSDTKFGGEESPGSYWHTEDDDLEHVSQQSLLVVGEVVLLGLEDVSEMLAKIDRFAKPRESADAAASQASEETDTPSEPAPAGEPPAPAEEPSAPATPEQPPAQMP